MAGLTFPTSQYIPQRLRGVIKSRLDHVGLWGMGGISQGESPLNRLICICLAVGLTLMIR